MKTTNYLFLSIFFLAGALPRIDSSHVDKNLQYHMVAYNQDIPGLSFLEQNKQNNYVDHDIAEIIMSYLPKIELKALYLRIPFDNKLMKNNQRLRIYAHIQDLIKNALMSINNPIHDIYVFKGISDMFSYDGWTRVGSTPSDLTKEKNFNNIQVFGIQFLDKFHSNSTFDYKKMSQDRLNANIYNINQLDTGSSLNLAQGESHFRYKEAYEKVLYPAYERMKKEKVSSSSFPIPSFNKEDMRIDIFNKLMPKIFTEYRRDIIEAKGLRQTYQETLDKLKKECHLDNNSVRAILNRAISQQNNSCIFTYRTAPDPTTGRYKILNLSLCSIAYFILENLNHNNIH